MTFAPHAAFPDTAHRSVAETGLPADPACPDLGARLSRFVVLRACGRTREQLAKAFGLSLEQVYALLARHGEPPGLAGRVAGDLQRAMRAELKQARRDRLIARHAQAAARLAGTPVGPQSGTHAAYSHPKD